MSGVNLQAIYNRLNSVPRYHPMSAKTFADWAMEAGDIVTVSRGGTSYQSPVGTSTLKWSGKQQIQIATEGSRERDAISRISARKYAKGGGGGSGMRGTQELYWEMFSEDGQLHAQIQATAEAIQTEVANLGTGLTTRIDQTDRAVGMSVGRTKYTTVATYSSKDHLPSTGNANILYHITATNQDYIWDPSAGRYQIASVDSEGNSATYIKTGEIALAFNEQTGQTEAKLDADVIYAGRGATTLADLELPDWMDTTTGLIATKATIVDLNALRARVGTLEADSITTDYLASHVITTRGLVVTNSIQAGGAIYANSGIYFGTPDGSSSLKQGFIGGRIDTSGNTYTLVMTDFNGTDHTIGTFSHATSLSGSWSGGRYTVTASPQGNTVSTSLLDTYTASGSPVQCNMYGNPDPNGKYIKQGISVLYDDGDDGRSTGRVIQVVSNASAVYNKGVEDGGGGFTPVTVTLQGQGRYVTAINADAWIKVTNTLKYNAGSPYTLYESGSWYDYNDVGSTTVYSRSHMMKLTYVGTISGMSGVYYKVDSNGTPYYQTSVYTPTRRTGYRRGSQVDGTNQGTAVAVYASDTNGTQYFRQGNTSYYYSAGSTVSDTYYVRTTT